MSRVTDYDRVAPTFDRRYDRSGYDRVAEYLLDWAEPRPGRRVLEIGCGTGHWLELLQRGGCEPTGIDPSGGMLAKARERENGDRLTRARAERLPFGDGHFERVFCLNAIHHVSDMRAALTEARRVLAPGGRFLTIGLDPHEGRDRWCIYDYFEGTLEIDKVRYPSGTAIRRGLEGAGFSETRTEVAEHLSLNESARVALERGRLHKSSTSQLSVLTDQEYERGVQAIQDDLRKCEADGVELRLSADLRLWATTATAR